MINKPNVSVIIPVYNEEKRIKRCLLSILMQSYKSLEIVVINDGSVDNSQKIIESIDDARIRVFEQDNKGRSFARNKALELAKGKYVLLQDADDYSKKYRLERQLGVSNCFGPEKCVVGCGVTIVKNGRRECDIQPGDPLIVHKKMKRPFKSHSIWPQTLLVKRELLEEVGGWREKFNASGQDGDLIDRLFRVKGVIFTNSESADYYYDVNENSVVGTPTNIRMQLFRRSCRNRSRKGLEEFDSFEDFYKYSTRNLFARSEYVFKSYVWKLYMKRLAGRK